MVASVGRIRRLVRIESLSYACMSCVSCRLILLLRSAPSAPDCNTGRNSVAFTYTPPRFQINMQDTLAEWSKALASGASPQGRGFEPHGCHFVFAIICVCVPFAPVVIALLVEVFRSFRFYGGITIMTCFTSSRSPLASLAQLVRA